MNQSNNTEPNTLEEIDRVIHEPARLNIMLYLYVVESADFTFLVYKTGLTRGNLSVHLQKLEQNALIEITKQFINRRPRTLVKLTPLGRNAFEIYRKTMLELLA